MCNSSEKDYTGICILLGIVVVLCYFSFQEHLEYVERENFIKSGYQQCNSLWKDRENLIRHEVLWQRECHVGVINDNKI